MNPAFAGILIGIAAGLLGSLCGVGGGILMVPVFTKWLGLKPPAAIATSLAVIVLTSLAATVQNVRSATPLIQWPLFAACSAGSVVASWLGADYMKTLRDDTLTRLFAVVMISVGVWMWISPSPSAPAPGKAEAEKKTND